MVVSRRSPVTFRPPPLHARGIRSARVTGTARVTTRADVGNARGSRDRRRIRSPVRTSHASVRRTPSSGRSAHVDPGAPVGVGLDLPDDLPNHRCGVAAAEDEVAEQVSQRVSLRPLEVRLRNYSGAIS